MAPSSHHVVTTVVMGNCGVGFAPVRPADHELLGAVENMVGKKFDGGLYDRIRNRGGEADLVRSGLEDTMMSAYDGIRETALRLDTDLRTDAFVKSIHKVALAYLERGIFP